MRRLPSPPPVPGILAILTVACMTLLTGSPEQAAQAGQWVTSPHPEAISGYVAAGGNCAAHATASGDRLLFFDNWSGTWTAHDLEGSHPIVRLLAGDEVALFVSDDLIVAFDGPNQAVHELPLAGEILDDEFSRPSFACGDRLAVVVTDVAMHIYDATRDAWASLANPVAYPAGHFETRAEPDFAYCQYALTSGRTINLAYSLRTGTFDRAEPGVSAISSYYLLDHGFAGKIYEATGEDRAMGYSAFTGEFTACGIGPWDPSILGVDRKRRALCHLWAYGWDEWGEEGVSHYHLQVYDTLTGSWSTRVHHYDNLELSLQTDPSIAGRFVTNYYCEHSGMGCAYCMGIFFGSDHAYLWRPLGLSGSNLHGCIGGEVSAWGASSSGPDTWWCMSESHRTGIAITTTEPEIGTHRAGDDWLLFSAYDPDQPLMDIHFYHGDQNSLITTRTWKDAYLDPPDLDGLHAYVMPVYGDDSDVIFYSARRHEVVHDRYPHGTHISYKLSDHLAMAYTSDDAGALYDPYTGILHHPAHAFGANNLGQYCCVGEDESALTVSAYSVITGTWATCAVTGDCHDQAGERVAISYRDNRSCYWGYGAEDATWTALVPASGTGGVPVVGGRTIVVADGDRLHAYWPDTWTAAPDDQAAPRSLASAVADVRCGPNPFNGRLSVALTLPYAADVRIDVFDVRGRRVAGLLQGLRPAGEVRATWQTGRAASGAYLLRVAADGHAAVRKVVLVE
jgi:hypothetical protein